MDNKKASSFDSDLAAPHRLPGVERMSAYDGHPRFDEVHPAPTRDDAFIETQTFPSSIAAADSVPHNKVYDTMHPGRDRSLDYHHVPGGRRYLPTLADLIDRLSIVQLKAVFLPERHAEYVAERKLIEHDIDLILREAFDRKEFRLNAKCVHAIAVIMLANRYMWENESKARSGGDEQDHLLKLTHSINGVRNTAKNVLAHELGERMDMKIDCFAEKLIKDYGQWNIWDNN